MASKNRIIREDSVDVVKPGGGTRKRSAMDQSKPSNDPSTRGLFWAAMARPWEKITTLLEGTDAMRAAGQTYLPKHPKEPADAYSERLECATLDNATSRTSVFLAYKPFSEPVTYEPGFPEDLKPLMDNIDGQGSDITAFAKDRFKTAIDLGYVHILVDAPSKEEGEVRTLADDIESGDQPYLVEIDPRDVIAARTVRRADREEYDHFRYYQSAVVWNGFEETIETLIRVLDLIPISDTEKRVRITEYVKTKDNATGKEIWGLVGEPKMTDQPRIMIHTFYTNRSGFLCSKPPLEELADLNITHWQSSSDQRANLTLSRFAMLAVSGVDTDEDGIKAPIVIGPNQVLSTDVAEAKYYYVEAGGAGLEAGAKDLIDLEGKMAQYGLKLLEKRPDRETAKSRELDEAGSLSPLQSMVRDYMDFFKGVLRDLMFMDSGKDTPLDQIEGIIIKTDFGVGAETADKQTVNSLILANVISQESGLEILKEFKVLPASFDISLNKKRLEQQIPLLQKYAQIAPPKAAASGEGPKEQPGENTDKKEPAAPGAPKK